MARRLVFALALFHGGFVCLVGNAVAQDHPSVAVLVAPEAEPRPGFTQALRIQIAGLAALVDAGSLPAAGTRSERIEHALAAVARVGAVAAVWFEGPFLRTDGAGELIVYVVGRRQDRAIVDIMRVPTTTTAATRNAVVNRSLALKVREVLWELTRGADVLTTFHAPETPSPAVTGEFTLGALVETASGSLQAQPGARLGAGVRLAWIDVELLVGARLHWLANDRTRAPVGTVSIAEISPALESTLFAIVHGIRIGARVGAQLRLLHATGTTATGVAGNATNALPSITLGPAVGFRLRRWLELSLALEATLTFRHQRYAIDNVVTADAGRLRGAAWVALSTIF